MHKISFIIIFLFHFTKCIGQQPFKEFIDRTIKTKDFSGTDWAIGLTTDQGGHIPIYDSLGNLIIDPEVNSTIYLSKIENKFYLQRFNRRCYEGDSCFYANRKFLIPENISCNFTIDTIIQADKEFIFPYIYKFDSLGVYVFQIPSGHETNYSMHFKTKNLDITVPFTRLDMSENLHFLRPNEKNVNYKYNSSTFIYRSFFYLLKLFKTYKIPLLQD